MLGDQFVDMCAFLVSKCSIVSFLEDVISPNNLMSYISDHYICFFGKVYTRVLPIRVYIYIYIKNIF